jgi:hypothetical protein
MPPGKHNKRINQDSCKLFNFYEKNKTGCDSICYNNRGRLEKDINETQRTMCESYGVPKPITKIKMKSYNDLLLELTQETKEIESELLKNEPLQIPKEILELEQSQEQKIEQPQPPKYKIEQEQQLSPDPSNTFVLQGDYYKPHHMYAHIDRYKQVLKRYDISNEKSLDVYKYCITGIIMQYFIINMILQKDIVNLNSESRNPLLFNLNKDEQQKMEEINSNFKEAKKYLDKFKELTLNNCDYYNDIISLELKYERIYNLYIQKFLGKRHDNKYLKYKEKYLKLKRTLLSQNK